MLGGFPHISLIALLQLTLFIILDPPHEGLVRQLDYDVPKPYSPIIREDESYDVPKPYHTSTPIRGENLNTAVNNPIDTYDIPKPYHKPHSILSGKGGGKANDMLSDSYISQMPQSSVFTDSYDVPKPYTDDQKSSQVPQSHIVIEDLDYDVPKSNNILAPTTNCDIKSNRTSVMSVGSSMISPSSSTSSLSLSSAAGSQSNRSSLEPGPQDNYDTLPEPRTVESDNKVYLEDPTYDVPRNNGKIMVVAPNGVYDVPPQVSREVNTDNHRLSIASSSGSSQSSRDSADLDLSSAEIPLELDSAVERNEKLKQEVVISGKKLIAFVQDNWRRPSNLAPHVYELRRSALQMRNALQEFCEFSKGVLVNASRSSDGNLVHRLNKSMKPLVDAYNIVKKTTDRLEQNHWALSVIGQEVSGAPDDIDQLIACVKHVPEDTRLVATFIQANAESLFKKSVLVIGVSQNVNDNQKIIEDYEYINLNPKDETDNKFGTLKNSVSNLKISGQTDCYATLTKKRVSTIDPNDKQVLKFYSPHLDSNLLSLNNAIDAFFSTIERNQPPKVSVSKKQLTHVFGVHTF